MRNVGRKILAVLKSRTGCSLSDLDFAVPERYRRFDRMLYERFESPDPIADLVRLGLVEAYHQNKPFTSEQRKWIGDWPIDTTFYISKRAIAIEDTLGIRLDKGMPHTSLDPSAAHTWPEFFVVMPFSVELRPVFDDHIRPVVSKLGLRVERADDFFQNGSIIQHIWAALDHAIIVLGDCTGRNPNVFYEIGIAHTLEKPTILIARTIEDVPFDIHHLRVIVYDFTPRGMAGFEENLRQTVTHILDDMSIYRETHDS